jgi:hypothetical protein
LYKRTCFTDTLASALEGGHGLNLTTTSKPHQHLTQKKKKKKEKKKGKEKEKKKTGITRQTSWRHSHLSSRSVSQFSLPAKSFSGGLSARLSMLLLPVGSSTTFSDQSWTIHSNRVGSAYGGLDEVRLCYALHAVQTGAWL